ncbi:hypothetical protein K443DRAFT_685545 [Laccaria amethystina LaAM-08-1]|uniref:Uncharacterized protein n=1 Tax=Laccaria amethystina LaAM-08-1 TaxID=1095629 RepID=A0A0C9X6C0_9AGAR|nr:hypothetical protein K443DRAFT_685545 [Laccaria amethystina LaAM-08-1]
MIDTPMQEVAQHEPCRSCSAALGAAVSMAKLVLRFEAATRDLISTPLTEEQASGLAEITRALEALPDPPVSEGQVLTDWDQVSTGSNEVEPVAEANDGTPVESSATSFVADSAINDHRWYAVTVGRAPGVYRGAYHLSGNSTGTPGGTVQRFADMHRALAAYQAAVLTGNVVEVTVTTTRRVITPNDPVTIVDQ